MHVCTTETYRNWKSLSTRGASTGHFTLFHLKKELTKNSGSSIAETSNGTEGMFSTNSGYLHSNSGSLGIFTLPLHKPSPASEEQLVCFHPRHCDKKLGIETSFPTQKPLLNFRNCWHVSTGWTLLGGFSTKVSSGMFPSEDPG